MKRIFIVLSVMLACLCSQLVFAAEVTQALQEKLTPEQIVDRLKSGNSSFVESSSKNLQLMQTAAKQGQHPLAFVLACVDSRSIPEVTLSQKKGAMFASRIAGNVADTDVIGSMEFAVGHAGSKVVLVMGHTSCGAVAAACNFDAGNFSGSLRDLLSQIVPAVKAARQANPNGQCSDPEFINAIAKQNVLQQIHMILNRSALISNLVKEKKVIILGGMHDLKTGKVTFFNAE